MPATAGGPIGVSGDGTPFRSYLYAADLAEWLVTILLRGRPGRAYNVGSEEAVSIAELATRVADVMAVEQPGRQRPEVAIAKQPVAGAAAARNVPDCRCARGELGLSATNCLAEAIRRTLIWASDRV